MSERTGVEKGSGGGIPKKLVVKLVLVKVLIVAAVAVVVIYAL